MSRRRRTISGDSSRRRPSTGGRVPCFCAVFRAFSRVFFFFLFFFFFFRSIDDTSVRFRPSPLLGDAANGAETLSYVDRQLNGVCLKDILSHHLQYLLAAETFVAFDSTRFVAIVPRGVSPWKRSP